MITNSNPYLEFLNQLTFNVDLPKWYLFASSVSSLLMFVNRANGQGVSPKQVSFSFRSGAMREKNDRHN